MFNDIWSQELPAEPLRYQWCWNRADSNEPEKFVPYDLISHQRKIEEAYNQKHDITEILVTKQQGKTTVLQAYTIRFDRDGGINHQQHQTGDPTYYRKIKREEI